MFYRALGYVVWNLAMKYLRQRYGRYAKPAVALTVASAIVAIYIATHDDDE